MDTADAAGGKYVDPGKRRTHHGGGDGGGAGFSGRKVGGEIAAGDLADIFTAAHQLQLLFGETDLDLSADERHGSGIGAARSDLLLDLSGKGEIFGVGHTVAENGAFQRYDRLAVFDGFLQLGTNVEIFFQFHVRCSSCNIKIFPSNGFQKAHRLGRTLHR